MQKLSKRHMVHYKAKKIKLKLGLIKFQELKKIK